nr:MAG TPA: resistance protein [Caudoviricetes sp.]
MTLYNLSREFADLIDQLQSADNGIDRNAILSELDKLNENVADKCEAYAKAMLNLTAEAEALTAESKRMQVLASRKRLAVDRLKRNVQNALVMTGARKVETSIGAWSMRKNPPKCVITDAESVPVEFLIPKPPEVNKKAILDQYKETGEIPEGVDITQEESVSFR